MSGSDASKRQTAHALFAVAFFFWFSQYAYASYINPVLLESGVSATFMGLVGGMYGFVQLVLRIPVGIAADRLNKQKFFVVLGCVLSLIAAVGMSISTAPVSVLIFRTLGGVACCSWVCHTVLYSRYFPAGESSGRITQLNTGSYFGRLGAYVTVAAFVALFDMRIAFVIGAVGAAISLLLCGKVENVGTDAPSASLAGYLSVMKEKNLLICSGLGILVQFVAFGTEYSFATNVQVALGATAQQVSYFSIALLVPSIIANYIVGQMILKKRSPKAILCFGMALMAAYCVLTPRVTQLWQFYPVQALAGVGNSCTIAVLLGQCVRRVPTQSRSTAMGFFQAAYAIGLSAGPSAMGVAIDHFGFTPSFDLMAVLAVLTIILSIRFLRSEE
ncbi:MAG: MFS transporter [Eubacteriales bacterium]|nr:MFS transporter [Eubacteriales bacterium]